MTGSPAELSAAFTRAARSPMALALERRCLEMTDRRGRGGADRRWQRGGEYEAGRIAANRIDQSCARGDVAAKAAERLGQRPFDESRRPMALAARPAPRRAGRTCLPHALRQRRSSRRAAPRGRRSLYRRDIAVHGIERLEHDELGRCGPAACNSCSRCVMSL